MNQEYITDVAYTSGYYGQLAPVWLNYIAAINGYAPRQLTEGFTYCELGCGNGLTTNVLAAANPDGRFWGADLNPEHITNAREVAQAGKLSNVTFLEKTFSDLLQEGLPDFDFVTLHGVWSWVSDEVRGQIKAFLRAKLKPGGIVLISYNTLPGWSAVLPMREMMLEYTRYLPGNSLDKVRQGLTYLRHLCDNGSHYFAHNPTAVRALEDMERSDPRYLAHEYFHANWEPCYFNRLNSEIRETGLTYAGALPLIENYQDLSVPAKLQPLLQTAPSRLLWETHKDFARNTRFRTDLYVNSELPPQNPQSAWFEDMAFGLPIPEQELINEVAVPAGSINVNGELYPALARILLDGPCTLETIRAQLAQAGHGEEDALLALQRTMLLGQCIPCRRPALPLGDAPPRLASPFNAAMLERTLFKDKQGTLLASPVAGLGLRFNHFEAALVRAACESDEPEHIAELAWGYAQASGTRIEASRDSTQRAPASREEAIGVFAQMHQPLAGKHFSQYRRYGILG